MVIDKKPFISTVRSGDRLPQLPPLTASTSNLSYIRSNTSDDIKASNATQLKNMQHEIEKLDNANKELLDYIQLYKDKVLKT